jgi:hypothetical protein
MTRPHLIPAPAPEPTSTPKGAWLGVSAAFTAHAPTFSGRDDLTVTCAPGTGRGAPGCFVPALAAIELDGTHLGLDPATCDPGRPSDWERYPALFGVFVHEAAHAAHTRWRAPTQGDAAHVEAATVLEESRIEAVHVRARPADRRWLRACASQLILADFTPDPNPGRAAGPAATPAQVRAAMTPWDAARAAALVLARRDADILEAEETASLAATVTEILGPSRLAALSAIWHLAHVTADTDTETMLELGRRWCAITGTDPDRPPPPPEPDDASTEPSPLSAAIGATLTAVAHAEAPLTSPRSDTSRQRQQEKEATDRSSATARRVFRPGASLDTRSGPGAGSAVTGSRAPTSAERTAARRLARALRAAAYRERVAVTSTSPTPPGRLRMRDAIAAEAQRAAGAIPTAEPFTQTRHRHTPAPPLRVGIACDVSGSMSALAGPVASAAWILARAVAYVPDAQSATVIFGHKVQAITYPRHAPTRVREFVAVDGYEQFIEAIDALDGALDLAPPGAARLLIIVSDGRYRPEQLTGGKKRIARLRAAGCGVLWIALDERARPMDSAHVVTLTNPAQAATTIGHAAAHALRHNLTA